MPTSFGFHRSYSKLFLRFGSNFYQPRVKVQAFTFPDFLSNVGGFMNLLAGISVLSIIEIFYHFVKHFFERNNKVPPEILTAISLKTKHKALLKFSKYFGDLIKSSDIHGLHYTESRSQGRCGRIFWAFLVALSMSTCSVLVVDLYKHAEKSPVALRIDPQTMSLDDVRTLLLFKLTPIAEIQSFQIPFPSVIICPDSDLEIYSKDWHCLVDGACENVNLDEV